MTSSLPTPEERRRSLETELDRLLPILVGLGVEKVLLIGSVARGTVHSMSDLDLMVIAGIEERFLDRLERFHEALAPRVSLDLLVYTPAELRELESWSSFVNEALKTARVLYDARSPSASQALAGAGPPRPR